MLPNMNLSRAKERSIDPGGYVLRILDTEVDMKFNRLLLKVDIVEGINSNYYANLSERFGFWGLHASLYLDEDSRWKFANAIEALRASNPDFEWNDDGENDERTLIGCYVGGILQKRHYMGNDGKQKSKLQVHHLVPVDDIRAGAFTVPDDKYADGAAPAQAPTGVVDTTADLPDGFYASSGEGPF